MRLRAVRRRAQQVRRALLPRRHPLHHLRPRSGVSLSLGGVAEGARPLRLLVDGRVPRRADHRLRLRVEEGGARMGVMQPGGLAPVPPGADQDKLLRSATDEMKERGFLVAQLDNLVNWARTGSLWP